MAQPAQTTTLPAPQAAAAAPAFMRGYVAEHEGEGVSTAAEDNLVPLVYVLQGLSPQVNARGDAYVEGAKVGDIWLRASQDPIADGEAGILFQPCHWSKCWLEWVPRSDGGGFVGRHAEQPREAQLRVVAGDDGQEREVLCMPNGNELRETREHVGYVLGRGAPQPYVIPFSSTGHTVSREWMTRMGLKQVDGRRAPSWACVYRLTTKHRKNKSGEWFVLSVADATEADGYPGGWVQTEAELQRGQQLRDAFKSGEKKSAAPEAAAQADLGSRPAAPAADEDQIPF